MRRRSGEKLSIAQRNLPLPSETGEDGLGPIPAVLPLEVTAERIGRA